MPDHPEPSSPSTDDRSDTPSNIVVLRGRVSSTPRQRELPSGTTLVQIEVTTPAADAPARAAAAAGAASVPVAWFDPGRARVPDQGDEIVVVGHARRRFFRAGGATVSRTEVVASRVIDARRRTQVERALGRVADSLTPTRASGTRTRSAASA